jgi:hypothetical protein
MTKKVLFFTAGPVPTADEQAQIDALNALTEPGYVVGVRNSKESAAFGAGVEACDMVAGTIPTEFEAKPDYGYASADRPAAFECCPDETTVAVSATVRIRAFRIDGTDISALEVTQVSQAADGTTWASSDETKATVSANGTVTGVAAGEVTITATHEFAEGKTVTATSVVTVTA